MLVLGVFKDRDVVGRWSAKESRRVLWGGPSLRRVFWLDDVKVRSRARMDDLGVFVRHFGEGSLGFVGDTASRVEYFLEPSPGCTGEYSMTLSNLETPRLDIVMLWVPGSALRWLDGVSLPAVPYEPNARHARRATGLFLGFHK